MDNYPNPEASRRQLIEYFAYDFDINIVIIDDFFSSWNELRFRELLRLAQWNPLFICELETFIQCFYDAIMKAITPPRLVRQYFDN